MFSAVVDARQGEAVRSILAFDRLPAQYYRQQAQRVRELAKGARDQDIRYEFERLAEIYERLATQLIADNRG
jgi:hypothetical protein